MKNKSKNEKESQQAVLTRKRRRSDMIAYSVLSTLLALTVIFLIVTMVMK